MRRILPPPLGQIPYQTQEALITVNQQQEETEEDDSNEGRRQKPQTVTAMEEIVKWLVVAVFIVFFPCQDPTATN